MNTLSGRTLLQPHVSLCRRAFIFDTGIHSHETMTNRYSMDYRILGPGTKAHHRRVVAAKGFFNSLFGKDSDSSSSKSTPSPDPDPVRDWSDEDIDEVVIMTWTDPSTSVEYNIVYRNGGLVDARGVEMLCDKINWPRRPQHKVDAALKNSFLVASLTLEEPGCTEPEKRRLIGTARCTSDGAFNATLWDVMVDPDFQGYGLGKALLELMVRSLLKRDISNITLFADSNVVEFYERLGFDCDPEGIKGMFFRFGY
jgi:GNAT superfamily N-acetyltransferase